MGQEDKFKKIDKEYKLTDNSLNCYKFRLLTEGYDLPEFQKNPIGFLMHKRSDGVVVKWTDFRIDGDAVWAKPVVNLSNPLGQRVVDEIENGFLNGASVGELVALEISTDPADYLPDQTGPTVTKWFNREASLVDIPGNFNSLTGLVDVNLNPINLDAFSKPNFSTMKQITLTAEQLGQMNLKADADAASIATAFNDLIAKASQVTNLTASLNTANTELATLKKSTSDKAVNDLIAGALVEKKITKETGDRLKKDYSENPDGLRDLIAGLPKYQSVSEAVEASKESNASELKDLMAKSYDELDKANKLMRLKEISLADFQAKYRGKFGKEYPTK